MPGSVLALDVGDARIGVAVANIEARLPRPLTTLQNDESFFELLHKLIAEHNVQTLVVGLPRGMEGQETAQTQKVAAFIMLLRKKVALPLFVQDEAATSVKAEEELRARGKPYEKSAIDALAATYILEDYLGETEHV